MVELRAFKVNKLEVETRLHPALSLNFKIRLNIM